MFPEVKLPQAVDKFINGPQQQKSISLLADMVITIGPALLI
jgi:hypothetical protein